MQLQRLHGDRFCTFRLHYKHAGLVAYEVSRVENAKEAEQAHADEQARAAALGREGKLAKGTQELPRKRVRACESSVPPPRKRVRVKGPGSNRAPPAAIAASVPAAGDGDVLDTVEPPASPAASDSEASFAESLGSLTDYLSDEEAAAPPQANDEELEAGPPQGDGSDASEEGEPQPGPFFDDRTGQVWSKPPGAADRFVLGRISLIKQGTPAEAVSLYCRMHGCSLMRRVTQSPSHQQTMKWFLDGMSLPRDRNPAVQRRHKDMLSRES